MLIIDRNIAKEDVSSQWAFPICYFPCWYVTWAQIVKFHFGISSCSQKVPGPKTKYFLHLQFPCLPLLKVCGMSLACQVYQQYVQIITFIFRGLCPLLHFLFRKNWDISGIPCCWCWTSGTCPTEQDQSAIVSKGLVFALRVQKARQPALLTGSDTLGSPCEQILLVDSTSGASSHSHRKWSFLYITKILYKMSNLPS